MNNDDKPQSECFVEKAHELTCDEDEAAFEDKSRQIARSPMRKANEKDKTPDK